MSLYQEFKSFVAKGNVVDLAIAVVIGTAFSGIVKAFVDGIIMPLISYVLPAGVKWEDWTLGKFRVGSVLGATFNFMVISLVVFLVLVKLLETFMKRKEAKPSTRTCPECLETIPISATRCKFCTSKLEP